jgi:hypothetical protein
MQRKLKLFNINNEMTKIWTGKEEFAIAQTIEGSKRLSLSSQLQ